MARSRRSGLAMRGTSTRYLHTTFSDPAAGSGRPDRASHRAEGKSDAAEADLSDARLAPVSGPRRGRPRRRPRLRAGPGAGPVAGDGRQAGDAQGDRDLRIHRPFPGLALGPGHLARHRLSREGAVHRGCAGQAGRRALPDRSPAVQGGRRPGGGAGRDRQDQGRPRQDQSRPGRGTAAHRQRHRRRLPVEAAGLPGVAGAASMPPMRRSPTTSSTSNFATITAPISGKIGRKLVSPGQSRGGQRRRRR